MRVKRRLRCLRPISLLPLVFALSSLTVNGENSDKKPETPTFWLIPHTHWEGAVFKTREEYLEMGLPNILTAIRLLKEHPNYRFVLDQVEYFRAFLERYPEEADAFRKFVAEGRLEIVGGLNVMPDDNMPSGESFIRQILYAKGYCREALKTEVTVGWLLDTFGHHAQMPQLLRLAGYHSFWFSRGVEDRSKMPSEFLWQGLDGTQIPSFWLPFFYGHLYGPPKDLAGFTKFIKERWDALAPFSRTRDRVGLAGVDVSEPELYVPALVEQLNSQRDLPFTLRIGVPSDFEAMVAKRSDLPVITGERNPLFQGIYSSRIELKQRMRETETLLTTAEKFGVLATWMGARVDEQMIWRAWEPALFNVTHDLTSGVMTDHVYEDTLRSYDFTKRLGDEMVETRLGDILKHIDTRGDGVPIVVFNTLGWVRTDVAQGDIGLAQAGIDDFALIDGNHKPVPCQWLDAENYEDGGLRRIKFCFVARDVPPLGYSVYHFIPRKSDEQHKPTINETKEATVLENEFYTIGVDPMTGALNSLRLKDDQWEALGGAGNIVASEVDNGDFWELYHNLDGAQNLIMTRPLNVPKTAQAHFSNEEPATNGVVTRGAVFSEVHSRHALGSNWLATTVRIYQGVPRIDFQTEILNNDKFVRYRLLVPTSIRNGRNVQEIPFGAIERPMAQEYPAQNWIDYSDDHHGMTLINHAMPGNNIADGTMMVSLMRSSRIQSYGIGGGFEGQGSDSGLELGKRLTLRYALVPHTGDWNAAGAHRAGLEFNNPLVVRKSAPHPGTLPGHWGLLEASPPNVILSALKLAKDGSTVVRVYEASGKATSGATISFQPKLMSVSEANLMEDTGANLRPANNSIRFDLRGFEIKTFKVHFKELK
ncbi:MAG TPA: glycoside hydrolase family 38 C-terminal domain-containing protein [Candidatus Limnocylindrales bacterium]|nr:glycoside hydrolase family 38 C-terminal domain-containing protein [Candidatus Limnocylindrales bacterium]